MTRHTASASRMIRFNKPYGVLSQFTAEGAWRGLKDFIDLPGVYVAGRLDADSEGLLLLTDDGQLQARIADPRFKMDKTYWVQVEGVPDETALAALRQGVMLKDGLTRPARVRPLAEPPNLWDRDPHGHRALWLGGLGAWGVGGCRGRIQRKMHLITLCR